MITFNSLKLQNHLLFNDLTWRLDKYPLSVIRGQNLDQRIESGNGVGKSLLPSTLATMLTDAPPMAQKKRSAKELIFNKSHLTLNLTNDQDNWQIEQYAKAKSVKHNIILNGVNQDVIKIDVARQFIKQAVPLSEDHIFSQLYISSFRPSVMLYGQPAARLNYFEQIFDLRIYDQLRKAVMTDLQKANQNFVKVKLLNEQKAGLQPSKNVAKRLKKIKLQHQRLLDQYAISHKAVQKLVEYVTLAEQLHSTHTYDQLKVKQKQYTDQIATYKSMLALQQKQQAEAQAAQQQIMQRKRLLKQLQGLQAYPNVTAKLAKISTSKQKLQKQVQQYNQYEQHIERYKTIAKIYLTGQAPDPQIVQEKLTTLDYRLKQKRKLRAGKPCPLCEQTVSKHLQHDVKLLKHSVKTTKQLLRKAKIISFVKKMQQKLPLALLQLDISQTHQKLQALRDTEQLWQGKAEQHEQYLELKAELKKLPKPAKQPNLSTIDYASKLEKAQDLLYRTKQDLKLLEKLAETENYGSLKEAKQALAIEQNTVATLTPKLQSIASLMQSLTETQSNYQNMQKQLIKIEQELNSLEQSLADKDILQALSLAYSAKGIRLLQIQSLAEAYIQSLNRFATHIYAMPVKFSAEVSPGAFPIMCERGKLVSDIKYLSGAESRQFLALSALTFCSLMPNHLRSNLLILDEIESGSSPVNRKKYASDFLPFVRDYVQNIVVITPYPETDFAIPDAKELTLVRKNNVTKWG